MTKQHTPYTSCKQCISEPIDDHSSWYPYCSITCFGNAGAGVVQETQKPEKRLFNLTEDSKKSSKIRYTKLQCEECFEHFTYICNRRHPGPSPRRCSHQCWEQSMLKGQFTPEFIKRNVPMVYSDPIRVSTPLIDEKEIALTKPARPIKKQVKEHPKQRTIKRYLFGVIPYTLSKCKICLESTYTLPTAEHVAENRHGEIMKARKPLQICNTCISQKKEYPQFHTIEKHRTLYPGTITRGAHPTIKEIENLRIAYKGGLRYTLRRWFGI